MESKICPKCNCTNVEVQIYQEHASSQTITKTKSKYKEKGHGCLWWLLIGWWWCFIDIFLWITLFIPRLLIRIFKKKKYVGKSTSVSSTTNQITYRSVFLCKGCGYHWEV